MPARRVKDQNPDIKEVFLWRKWSDPLVIEKLGIRPAEHVPPELSFIKTEMLEYPRPYRVGSCVYFLIHHKQIVYIGQTTNLFRRLYDHYTKRKFTRVLFFRIPKRKRLRAEEKLIRILRPPGNIRITDDRYERELAASGWVDEPEEA